MGSISRKLWTDKILGQKQTSCKQLAEKSNYFGKRILGIDPSLRGTGLAVVESSHGGRMSLHFSKTIKLGNALTEYECLGKIFLAISDVINSFDIFSVAMEKIIFVKNPKIAQIMGAAKGAAIAAIATKNIKISEYAPLKIKKAVAGQGMATKMQVAFMVKNILSLNEQLPSDESDAAAVAICHINNSHIS